LAAHNTHISKNQKVVIAKLQMLHTGML